MFRYMAVVRHAGDRSQVETAQLLSRRIQSDPAEWRLVFDRDGLSVFCIGDRAGGSEPLLLSDQGGVVLGTLFGRIDAGALSLPHRVVSGQLPAAGILARGGRELIDSYWGRYVAFLSDCASGRKWIVKDPTGNLPCYYTDFRGVSIFFSCMTDCLRLDLLQLTLNWKYITARVAMGAQQVDQTAFNEVSEVHGGECVEIGAGRLSRKFYWNPLDIADSQSIEDSQRAAVELRSVTRSAVQAWASCHQHIIHRLSGGLDSSIVLGCLGNAAESKTTCLTYYVPDGISDERPWARLAAERTACKHIEHARDPRVDIRTLLQTAPSVNPPSGFSFLETGPVERQLARDTGATAVFTGDGGDSIFGRHAAQTAAAEHWRRHRYSPGVFKVAMDVALLGNTSIWEVLGNIFRSEVLGRGDRYGEAMLSERKLIAKGIADSIATRRKGPAHPWFGATDRVPWRIVLQTATLIHPRWFYDPGCNPDGADPEPVNPLLSQPVVELCLRIPMHVHIRGGRSRALARRAFMPDVPREILERQWKDRVPGFFEAMFAWNVGFAREMLLDGVLVKEKLLDCRRLEQALSRVPGKDIPWVGEILDYLIIEAWLRSWTSMRPAPDVRGPDQKVLAMVT